MSLVFDPMLAGVNINAAAVGGGTMLMRAVGITIWRLEIPSVNVVVCFQSLVFPAR